MRFSIRASAPRAANVILMDNCPVRLALEREQTPAAFRPWRPSPPPLRRDDRSYSSPRSVPRGSAGSAGGPPSVLRDPQEALGAGRARPQELEEITDGAEPSGIRELFIQGHAGIKDQIELPASPSPRHAPSKINRNNRRGRRFQPCDSPQSIEMSALPQTKIHSLHRPTTRAPRRSDDPLVIHRPQISCTKNPTIPRTRRGKSTSHEEGFPPLNPRRQGHRVLQRMRPPQAPRKNRRAGQHKNQDDNLDLSPAPAP